MSLRAALLSLPFLLSCAPRDPATQRSAPAEAVPVPDAGAGPSPSTTPADAVACLPVYLEGSCPAGCAALPLPFTPQARMTVSACGFSHRVASRQDPESGETVWFLVPLPPSGQRYRGPICSARAPDNEMCAGRCAAGCTTDDLGKSFGP